MALQWKLIIGHDIFVGPVCRPLAKITSCLLGIRLPPWINRVNSDVGPHLVRQRDAQDTLIIEGRP